MISNISKEAQYNVSPSLGGYSGYCVDRTGQREMTAEDLGLAYDDCCNIHGYYAALRNDAPYAFWLGAEAA